jgi:uncharacterized membrane protein YuzA (DUF378 family)
MPKGIYIEDERLLKGLFKFNVIALVYDDSRVIYLIIGTSSVA